MQQPKLYGFNNLTKSLNFCIYDICYANTKKACHNYITYIDKKYNTSSFTEILVKVCSIIGANILNISRQDYTPQGASVNLLVGESPITTPSVKNITPSVKNITPSVNNIASKKLKNLSNSVVFHLDKSHICVHTYPEIHPKEGICSFRADIDISTCGLISPLKALNYLINHLDSDIITIDYRIRGFTRDINGKKHFIDHKIYSIQNFMSMDILSMYDTTDVNFYKENTYHTKMVSKNFDLKNHLFQTTKKDFTNKEYQRVSTLLWKEIHEIYQSQNFSS
ncbi:adenosylmethionine decarboxylase [Candidatus Tachikawaea gelatinosa]|uniref:S-adenosylmethionine decarboxylase proenzyme n=1 Tax=Candidatus Tachikawaea gelatinosa TaxID=1410383 RepID=A0A090AQ90_9ENTR|nr:adenosylmethionine decarboxylase [Candidatus Tachikawaea gelatinosa]BAP58512.1 S-adenosylmethionine decarboxylase proenzyme [Candidatus Tachikawaea gelatinosa]